MRNVMIRATCLIGGAAMLVTSLYMNRFDRMALPHPSVESIALFLLGGVVVLGTTVSTVLSWLSSQASHRRRRYFDVLPIEHDKLR